MTLRSLLTSGQLADEFARLRSDLAALRPAPRHIVVLGASGGEGVTTVAAHLAVALAAVAEPNRVLLAEGNVHRSALAKELGLQSGNGLLDWDLKAPLPTQPCPGAERLRVLAAGTGAKRLGGPSNQERLLAAVAKARDEYDCVIWDAPAVTSHADGLTLAGACDGALVVVEMDQSRVDGLAYVRDSLERNHARLLGSVLNRTGRYWPRPGRAAAQADGPSA